MNNVYNCYYKMTNCVSDQSCGEVFHDFLIYHEKCNITNNEHRKETMISYIILESSPNFIHKYHPETPINTIRYTI